MFITDKAGSGKSCFIGQIINEYKNIDGAIVLTATCPEAAKYCIANVSQNEKYPVLLQYLFKKFIEICGIGESFYTMENFAMLIDDRIKRGNDVVIALDAMDEIALQDNTRAFVEHVEELQEFCGNKVKVIITDRGRTAAKMFGRAPVCELKEFNDDNVNKYCVKLFRVLEKRGLTNKKLNIDVSDLKYKVNRLSDDIKRNPFMLTQVVSLYAMTGKINDSEIGMFDDISDVMFKSERLKYKSANIKEKEIVMPSNIVEMLSEFAYLRQVTLSEGGCMTRSMAVKLFNRLLGESGETARSGITGEKLTEYIVFRAFYSFKENKFFHESYGEYLTARYFCDKVLDEFGDVVDQKSLDELLSHCGDAHWTLIINIFIRKSSIKKIVIPEGVKSIGESSCSDCCSFKEITICDKEATTKGCLSVFACCTSLEKVTISKGVKNICTFAFYGCSSLEEVTICEGVESIGGWAFDGCSSLKEVTICEGVKVISLWTFVGCSSLKEIKMPDSLTDIGEMAFYECTSLEKVTIPKGVKSIWTAAFDGCCALKAVYFVNTKGWRAGDDEISPDDLSDPAKAAYLLKEKYVIHEWERG